MNRIRVRDCLRRSGELCAVSDSPGLDLELLLTQALARSRAWLIAHRDELISPIDLTSFHYLLKRRLNGEPMAYILGQREFWSLPLEVNSSVLIPRPETELLVEAALERCSASTRRIADLGTGSGAISAAMAKELGQVVVLATDISKAAISLARKNLRKLGFESRVHLLQADWGAPLSDCSLDLLLCNPPYLAVDDPDLTTLAYEPREALIADRAGRAELDRVAQEACRLLKDTGWLLLEHGYDQGSEVSRHLIDLGYHEVRTLTDLAGRPRVTLGRWRR